MEVTKMCEFYFENSEDYKYVDKLINEDYLRGLDSRVSNELYAEILRCFMEKDMATLGKIIVQLAIGFEKSQSTEEKIATIRVLEEKVKILEGELKKQIKTNRELDTEVNSLRRELFGTKQWQYLYIKNLYQSGSSLRQIGKILNCDKSTVKRKLIKMGIQIRK